MLYHLVYTRVQVKCVQYWPNTVGETQTYGPLNVSLTEEFEFADYVVRTVELRVKQFYSTRVLFIYLFAYRTLQWVISYMWSLSITSQPGQIMECQIMPLQFLLFIEGFVAPTKPP